MNKRHKYPATNHEPCRNCTPDPRFRLLSPDEIMHKPTTDDQSFSLKVYTAAYFISMQEYTGDAQGADSSVLLELCSDEISRGHMIAIR